MLVRSVVDHKIEDDFYVPLFSFRNHAIEIAERAVHRIDIFVIRDVIAEIDLGRGKTRGNPDSVDAKIFQIIEFGGYAIQIADAIVVAVEKCADVDLVNYRALVPGCILSGGQIPSPGVVLPTDIRIFEIAVLRCAVTIGLFL